MIIKLFLLVSIFSLMLNSIRLLQSTFSYSYIDAPTTLKMFYSYLQVFLAIRGGSVPEKSQTANNKTGILGRN